MVEMKVLQIGMHKHLLLVPFAIIKFHSISESLMLTLDSLSVFLLIILNATN